MSTTCVRRPHSVWTTCPCDTCRVDRLRLAKRHRAGLYKRVPSDEARDTLQRLRDAGWTAHAIASATGLHYRTIDRNLVGALIGPTIAARIVNYGDPTAGSVGAAGTRRRLQALAFHGYDLKTISDATGIGFSTLASIRSGAVNRVRSAFYTTIRDYTQGLGMQLGPSTGSRQHAQRHGWVGLLAWDDIDNDPQPQGGDDQHHHSDVDEAVVTRVLAGEKLPTTAAERRAILARWVAQGRSARSIEKRMGWKESRYRGEVA